MNLPQKRWFFITSRWIFYIALAGIFLYAGITKLAAPQAFADSIATFQLLPAGLINLVALGLPPFEILAAIAVLTGIQRRPALLALVLLSIVFIAALSSSIVRGISVDCGCFGSEKPTEFTAWIAIARDIPILATALFLYCVELKKRSTYFDKAK